MKSRQVATIGLLLIVVGLIVGTLFLSNQTQESQEIEDAQNAYLAHRTRFLKQIDTFRNGELQERVEGHVLNDYDLESCLRTAHFNHRLKNVRLNRGSKKHFQNLRAIAKLLEE